MKEKKVIIYQDSDEGGNYWTFCFYGWYHL